MPSQLSANTSTTSSDYSVRVNGTLEQARSGNPLPTANDGQVTASLVGNIVCSRKVETMGASVQEVGAWANTAFKSLCNGESLLATGKASGHNGHPTLGDRTNGLLPMEPTVSFPKTRGTHSNESSSLTAHSDAGRLIQPCEARLRARELVGSKSEELTRRQRTLQARCRALLLQVQEKQLSLAGRHVWSQLVEGEGQDSSTCRSGAAINESLTSSRTSPGHALSFPIQVDGASDSPPLNQLSFETPVDDSVEGVVTGCMVPPTRSRCDDSFSSLESYASSSSLTGSQAGVEGDHFSGRTRRVLRAQGVSMATLADPDFTDSSSDEEEMDVMIVEEQLNT